MDTKKTAMLILAGKPTGAEDKPETPKLESLLEEFADALRAKDYACAAKAFKAAHGVCGAGYEDEGDSEEL